MVQAEQALALDMSSQFKLCVLMPDISFEEAEIQFLITVELCCCGAFALSTPRILRS